MKLKLTILAILLLAFVVACGGGGADAPAPELEIPTEIPAGDAIAQTEPTATTAVVEPTLPPPPTLAPPPATATALPEPTAEADPVDDGTITLLTKEDFGTDRNPFTGEVLEDPSVLQRRPLAIKISNAPAFYVRPQSGLNKADWIFEHLAEGAVTRFTALIYGETPAEVGPIRSARLIDLELPAMYDAALLFSGTSTGVGNRLAQSDIYDHIVRVSETGTGYFRTGDETKAFEHTLYMRPERTWEHLESKGLNHPPEINTQVAFSSEPPANGRSNSGAFIDYQSTEVTWTYDPEIGLYRREADGGPIIDALDEEQVTAANVVIISPFHVEDGTICEHSKDGVCLALSVEIQLWGSGQGVILRDGQEYDVIWVREGRNDMLTFTDLEGNPFPLQIGNTWVQLIPSWLDDPVEIYP